MAATKVELVATYEEYAQIPREKCMTKYFGDYSLWVEKGESEGFNPALYNERFNAALRFLGISEEEYYDNSDFIQRGKIKEAFNQKFYEFYKEDWYKEHSIPDEDIIKLQDEWQFAKAYSDFEGSFEDYELEYGYNGGEVYVCFAEFIDNEFEEYHDVIKYNSRDEVETVVYNWLNGFRETGFCAVTNLDIDSAEYKNMVALVEGLCADEFPELYEAVFGSDSGSVDLIFRDKYDEDGFNLYYYNPDSVAGGQIVQCPFDREDAPEMVDNEDYIDVLAGHVQYLADIDAEHFFNDIFELLDFKQDGLYLGDYVDDVCRYIVFESEHALPFELAWFDAEKTMIDVYVDSEGQKRIHYLGYFYNNGDGLKLNEYTGYDVPFNNVLETGILEFESKNSNEFSHNQYITDYDEGLNNAEIFNIINNYFEGTTPVYLSKDSQFTDLPVGVYAISIYTKDQLIAAHNAYEVEHVSTEEIYKHQCEISNLRHELEGALMYDPAKAAVIEKILDKRMCELDAMLSGRPLDEVLADAKVASDNQRCDLKGTPDRENVME